MSRRIAGALVAVFIGMVLASADIGGQTPVPAAAKPTPPVKAAYSPSKTPDGRPDLQGYWTNATYTPLERPAEFAGREFMTEAEAVAYQTKKELEDNAQSKEDIHYDNVLWQTESYTKDVTARRTSVIYDPADGRIPPLTPAAQARAAAQADAARRRGPADAAEFRNLQERCISWGNEGPPMLGATYYNNLQILQAGHHVVIRHELMHGVRIIPVDGTPHANIPMLHGNSRGRWDGNTLVVETIRFTDRTPFRAPPMTGRQDIFSGDQLKVTERLTRTGAGTIRYQFTLDDPGTWVRPWSGEIVMRKFEGPIFEYACHEGNYGLAFILSAGRAAEGARNQVLGLSIR